MDFRLEQVIKSGDFPHFRQIIQYGNIYFGCINSNEKCRVGDIFTIKLAKYCGTKFRIIFEKFVLLNLCAFLVLLSKTQGFEIFEANDKI